jgi:uncharacterized lipoprotein YajG
MKRKQVYSILIVSVFIFAFGYGCGYRVHRHTALPFKDIHIFPIENRTLEPKLQDKLHRALVKEFTKHGVRINPSSRTRLTGTIHTFDMLSLSVKDDTTAEYRVNASVNFTVHNANGNIQEIKNIRSPFIVSFSGIEALSETLANRDVAEEMALADVAMQIVGFLIY